MGYNTQYNIKTNPEMLLPIDFCETVGCDEWGDFEESCKWYEYEQDMRELSSIYPNVLFTLSGEGDESEDLWVAYFKAGRVQKEYAKITYDEFDENKLMCISNPK